MMWTQRAKSKDTEESWNPSIDDDLLLHCLSSKCSKNTFKCWGAQKIPHSESSPLPDDTTARTLLTSVWQPIKLHLKWRVTAREGPRLDLFYILYLVCAEQVASPQTELKRRGKRDEIQRAETGESMRRGTPQAARVQGSVQSSETNNTCVIMHSSWKTN